MPGVVPACPSKHPRHTAVVSAAKHRRAAFFSASCCICCASSRIRCPDTAAFRFSPPLVARPLARLAIRSGKSHPDLQTQPQPVRHHFERHRSRAIRPPDRYGRVRAVRDSPSNATTCRRAVPTGTHSEKLPGEIDATDTSASRAWVHVGQPAPKTALNASHEALYRPG